MPDDKIYSERLWEKGWGGHEKAQLVRMSRLSFREKISWLENAQEVMLRLSKGQNQGKRKIDCWKE